MSKSPPQVTKVRTSIRLPGVYIAAMDAIKKHERVLYSFQIELGLVKYFREHKESLAKEGISLDTL